MGGILHTQRHPRACPDDPTTFQSIERLQMLGTGPSMTEERFRNLNQPVNGGDSPIHCL